MAEVHIVDIDGEQWDMKDQPLTTRVATLESLLTIKTKENQNIQLIQGFSAADANIINILQFGNILQFTVIISDISGGYIGTTRTVKIGTCNIKPIKELSFILRDYTSGNTVRCAIDEDGNFYFYESNGIAQGSNHIRGSAVMIV